jgi:hypothetical protein
MTDTDWTEWDIGAAILLRLDTRAAASESTLLSVDQPTLSSEQLHWARGHGLSW